MSRSSGIWREGADKVTSRRDPFDKPPSKLAPEPHSRRVVAAVDAVYGEEYRGIAIFSVCDGKTGIGAGDNNIAVANYLNAKPFTTN